MKIYELEFYAPDRTSRDDIVCLIRSSEAFLPIQTGDLINPRLWSPGALEMLRNFCPDGMLLKVLGVEHMIQELQDQLILHKICISSTAIPDAPAARGFLQAPAMSPQDAYRRLCDSGSATDN
jgi:hypothetical protein